MDPQRNLAAAQDLLPLYRRLFPEAIVLEGPRATATAMRRALEASPWLHLDVHGTFDAAVPELSSLRLADGPMTLVEFADGGIHLEAANLSGCHTGRWPLTADSGHYGAAGRLARGGVRWVVGSRWSLADDLARDINSTLYPALAEGESWPCAYHQALEAARRRHPPQRWATLMLLEAPTHSLSGQPSGDPALEPRFKPTSNPGGQSEFECTPSSTEERDDDIWRKETP